MPLGTRKLDFASTTTAVRMTRKLFRKHPFRPTVIGRAPGEIISDKLIVYRSDFLLRRGARWFEGTALRGRRPLRRAGGAFRHSGLA